jgi:copper chaperone NosL
LSYSRTGLFFDGPNNLFTYYHNIGIYSPNRSRSDIAAVWVKNYKALTAIDGMREVYVIGSNVLGPKGGEFMPFMKESEAALIL